ncbi:MAG: 2-phosphosulfolactate phosphatase [Bacteroidota bacterium]
MDFNQEDFNIRLEWGMKGVKVLSPVSDVLIIVDILSFSTSVDIATSRGATILPYPYKDATAKSYAREKEALLAEPKRTLSQALSLSPSSLIQIASGTRLVLPSPNGSTLSFATGETPTLCGCLRNARAVAEYAMSLGSRISVIPAGEKWEDGSLRVALEDYIGAGAIISYLKGLLSPESKSSLTVFNAIESQLSHTLKGCNSGRELIERGFEQDVLLAADLNVSSTVPFLTNRCYTGHPTI